MKAERIFETVLYASDLRAAERFYTSVLGLEMIDRGAVALVLRCGSGVLLIFDPEKSTAADRGVPSHGAKGPGHIAFALAESSDSAWRAHLARCGVKIEMEVSWPQGNRSIYFRDPAGNSVELAPPTLWG